LNAPDNYDPDPISFMREFGKDRIKFLQGGDYRMKKDEIIYAV
jgi:hypothetical protein